MFKEMLRVWFHFTFAFGSFIVNCFAEKYPFPKLAPGELVDESIDLTYPLFYIFF
jgi:hypothetical protein